MLCDVSIASYSSAGIKGLVVFFRIIRLEVEFLFLFVVFESKEMWMGVVNGRICRKYLS